MKEDLIVDIDVSFPPGSPHQKLTACFTVPGEGNDKGAVQEWANFQFKHKFGAIMRASRGELELESPVESVEARNAKVWEER